METLIRHHVENVDENYQKYRRSTASDYIEVR